MIRRTRDRGGFPIHSLLIVTVLFGLCILAFVLLGRLGWPWWVRAPVIIGSLYGLAFLLLALLPRDGTTPDSRSRGPTDESK